MRNLFTILSATLLLACNHQENNKNDASQKNLNAGRVVTDAFLTGDPKGLDSVLTSDFVDHTDMGDKVGPDSLKAMVVMMHSKFPDMKIDALREVADSNYLFQWMRYTGTSDGSMGMPAGPFDMHAVEVSRLRNGKIVEHWAYIDMSEMMKMMGNVQQPTASKATSNSMSPGADSAGKY